MALMDKSRDNYFKRPMKEVSPFSFDQAEVADCFDDMLSRSIPSYHEVQRLLGNIFCAYAQVGDRVYDLGCSTGTTLQMLAQKLKGVPCN